MLNRFVLESQVLPTAMPLAGCSSTSQVVKQASMSELIGARRFTLLPVAFSSLRVGTVSETVYLARKDQDQTAAWEADKLAIREAFALQLRDEAARRSIEVVGAGDLPAPMTIRPIVRYIEPGFHMSLAWRRSEVRMNVQVLGDGGVVTDEIHLEHRTMPSLTKTTARERLRYDAARLAEAFIEYLHGRVGVN